jgi:hypothetical protein
LVRLRENGAVRVYRTGAAAEETDATAGGARKADVERRDEEAFSDALSLTRPEGRWEKWSKIGPAGTGAAPDWREERRRGVDGPDIEPWWRA